MRPNRWLRFRVPLGFLFAAWYLWLTRYAQPGTVWLSATLIVLGCGLRSWAAGYLFKGKRVAVGGPYAYIRNPLYVGSFVIGLGFCAALYQWPLPLPVLLFWTVYVAGFVLMYVAKGRAEETELLDSLGSAYAAYRSQVPALLPLRWKVDGLGAQKFSSELYRRNREYQCILGGVAALAVVVWRALHAA